MRVQDREWERVIVLVNQLLRPHRKQNAPPITARTLIGRNLTIWPTRDDDGNS